MSAAQVPKSARIVFDVVAVESARHPLLSGVVSRLVGTVMLHFPIVG